MTKIANPPRDKRRALIEPTPTPCTVEPLTGVVDVVAVRPYGLLVAVDHTFVVVPWHRVVSMEEP